MSSIADQYSADYYERGVETGISGYTNYHWRPEYSLPFASELKRRFLADLPPAEQTAFDYGCAKGFLVKALRLLDIHAFGFDISEYAIKCADSRFCSDNPMKFLARYSLVISKDTLEHVPHADISRVIFQLRELTAPAGYCVITVPLGDSKTYRIREYELDKTHIIREDEEWWINRCKSAGFEIVDFDYAFPGAKDHWLKVHPHGNGTFILRKQGQW